MNGFDKAGALADPFDQFAQWYESARQALSEWASAMILATVSPAGQPSVRTVLLKHVDQRGFAFYTNLESRKAEEIQANPHAAVVFWWQPLEYQVRIEGVMVRTSDEESDAYFATRPRESQLAAWASDQSRSIASRALLEDRMKEVTDRFEGRTIPRPPYWGGYRLIPHTFEFWHGRPGRLHDRLRYRRTETGDWRIDRLMP